MIVYLVGRRGIPPLVSTVYRKKVQDNKYTNKKKVKSEIKRLQMGSWRLCVAILRFEAISGNHRFLEAFGQRRAN